MGSNAHRKLWKSAGGDAPSHWQFHSIEELLEHSKSISVGVMYPGGDSPDGVPLIKVADVKNGSVIAEPSYRVSAKVDEEYKRTRLDGTELLITLVGNPGDCVVVRPEMAGWNVARALAVVRLADIELRQWIRHVLLSRPAKHLIDVRLNTTVQKTLNLKDIRLLGIPVPSKSERDSITRVISALDDKIELNRRMNVTLEGMAQALFKSWFVDFDPVIDNALAAGNPIPAELADRAEVRRAALADGTANREAAKPFPAAFQQTEQLGAIPEGWEVKAFGEVSICSDRKRVPLSKKQRSEKQPGAIPYYGATSVMDYIDEWIFDDVYLLIGEDGSVMHEDGSPFVQYIWRKSWVNNHAHVLQGTDGITTEHLMLFMKAQDVTPYVTGAVQLKINQKNMNSIPFVKATDEINESFAATVGPLYDRYKMLVTESESLTKLRNTLLPKLISGELRIPDAEKLAEEALA